MLTPPPELLAWFEAPIEVEARVAVRPTIRGRGSLVPSFDCGGTLDLRGFLGLDDRVPPGYVEIDYQVSINGDGSREDFEEIHQTVMKTSPNYFNMSRPIRMNGTLHVG